MILNFKTLVRVIYIKKIDIRMNKKNMIFKIRYIKKIIIVMKISILTSLVIRHIFAYSPHKTYFDSTQESARGGVHTRHWFHTRIAQSTQDLFWFHTRIGQGQRPHKTLIPHKNRPVHTRLIFDSTQESASPHKT